MAPPSRARSSTAWTRLVPTPVPRWSGTTATERSSADSVVRLDGRAADEAIAVAGDHAGREGLGRPVEGQCRPRSAGRGRPASRRPLRASSASAAAGAAAAAAASATGSISRGAERSMSGRASAGLVALMIALIIPSVTVCDGVMETSVRPTASRPSRNSETDRAPAMQPAKEPRSARCSALSESSATMSLMPMRPPGRRTRAISAKTACLSAARLTTQLLMTTSIDSAGSGSASMWPLRNSTLVAPAWAAFGLGQREHLVGHVDAEGATGRADPLGREEDVDAAAGARGRGRARPDGGRRPRSGCRSRARPGPRRPAVRRARARSRGSRRWSRGRCNTRSPGRRGPRHRRSAGERSRGWSRWSSGVAVVSVLLGAVGP